MIREDFNVNSTHFRNNSENHAMSTKIYVNQKGQKI